MRMKRVVLLFLVMMLVFAATATAGLTDGLVGYYAFNGNANDESGNGNHGTVNGATLTTDRFGNPNSAYYFDGVDDYIVTGEVSDTMILCGTTPSTISLWIKSSAYPTQGSGYVAPITFSERGVYSQIVGEGKGNSPEKRINALKNMIKSAGDLIDNGDITGACEQLGSILKKVDGQINPPDFISGSGTPGVAGGISGIMTNLGCN